MNYSTFWTIKAVLGWGAAVTGLWWADEGALARLWVLILAAAITCSVIAVMFRRDERALAAFEAGLELAPRVHPTSVAGLRRRG